MRTLQSRQRSLPVLFVTMLLTIVAIVAAAYFGARASALNTAQERLGQDAQIASEMVAERGQYASLQGDKLVVGVGNATYTLTNDTYVVDHIQDVTGDQAIIYRLDGTRLLSVASTFSAPGSAGNGTTNTSARQVGDVLTGPARDAILGHCPPGATGSACRGRFSGVMTLRGQSMMAAFVPLLDINGKLVGAVGVARPLDAVLQPPTQLVIVLAFVGLLVALISLGIGTWILGVRGDQAIAELGQRLEAMARSATEVRQLVQLQSGRLQRQERAVRQVSELARELDPLVGTMEREQVSLRQSATDIWAEMSQPGVAPNPATALQLARASAVAAARVGATGEEVRAQPPSPWPPQPGDRGRARADRGRAGGGTARGRAASNHRGCRADAWRPHHRAAPRAAQSAVHAPWGRTATSDSAPGCRSGQAYRSASCGPTHRLQPVCGGQ